MKNKGSENGFTIIEVVLVLAIAGLIFLVVFLALPALQRSQRDTQRKDDLGRMASSLTTYQSNNKGKLPTSGEISQRGTEASFTKNYLTNGGSTFNDPKNNMSYTVIYKAGDISSEPVGTIYYMPNASCGTEGKIVQDGGAPFAVSIKTENGGGYCQQG